MISKHSKQAADKVTPTSESTVARPQGSCCISTQGEQRTATGQMKIKK